MELVVRTLLLLDLVDSTGLVTRLGDREASRRLGEFDLLVRNLLPEYGGQEIDRTDGYLILFERPVDGAACMLRLFTLLREKSELELVARAALHTGEVVLRENPAEFVTRGAKPMEVDGQAKMLVARTCALAMGSQLLLTRTAFDLARRGAVGEDRLPENLQWRAHGPYRMKGIEEPLEVFEAGVEGSAPLTPPPDSEKARRALTPEEEELLGWRPSRGGIVPLRPNYRLDARLGEGGFGEVWLARNQKTREPRVYKFCFEASRLRGLKREVTLFRLLRDALGERKDIARVLDWNLDSFPYFIESEHTEGGDLAQWALEQGGIAAVPLETRLRIIAEVAEALSAAHSVGVLHKDIKASNVLVYTDEGGRPHARLTDFGIGMLHDRETLQRLGITATGLTDSLLSGNESSRSGTRLYMAPELMEGKTPSIASDVYSLGVLLFQVVAGDLGTALGSGWERLIADPLIREDIAHCTDRSPENRFASSRDLAESIRQLDARREAIREAERAARAQKRRRLLAVGLAAAIVLLLILSGLTLRESGLRAQAQAARVDAEAALVRAQSSEAEARLALEQTQLSLEALDFLSSATDLRKPGERQFITKLQSFRDSLTENDLRKPEFLLEFSQRLVKIAEVLQQVESIWGSRDSETALNVAQVASDIILKIHDSSTTEEARARTMSHFAKALGQKTAMYMGALGSARRRGTQQSGLVAWSERLSAEWPRVIEHFEDVDDSVATLAALLLTHQMFEVEERGRTSESSHQLLLEHRARLLHAMTESPDAESLKALSALDGWLVRVEYDRAGLPAAQAEAKRLLADWSERLLAVLPNPGSDPGIASLRVWASVEKAITPGEAFAEWGPRKAADSGGVVLGFAPEESILVKGKLRTGPIPRPIARVAPTARQRADAFGSWIVGDDGTRLALILAAPAGEYGVLSATSGDTIVVEANYAGSSSPDDVGASGLLMTTGVPAILERGSLATSTIASLDLLKELPDGTEVTIEATVLGFSSDENTIYLSSGPQGFVIASMALSEGEPWAEGLAIGSRVQMSGIHRPVAAGFSYLTVAEKRMKVVAPPAPDTESPAAQLKIPMFESGLPIAAYRGLIVFRLPYSRSTIARNGSTLTLIDSASRREFEFALLGGSDAALARIQEIKLGEEIELIAYCAGNPQAPAGQYIASFPPLIRTTGARRAVLGYVDPAQANWSTTMPLADFLAARDLTGQLTLEGKVQDLLPSGRDNVPHRLLLMDEAGTNTVRVTFWNNLGTWTQFAVERTRPGARVRVSGRYEYFEGSPQLRCNANSLFELDGILLNSILPDSEEAREAALPAREWPPQKTLKEASELPMSTRVTVQGTVATYNASTAANVPHRLSITDDTMPEGFAVVFWNNNGPWAADAANVIKVGSVIRFSGITAAFRGTRQVSGLADSMFELVSATSAKPSAEGDGEIAKQMQTGDCADPEKINACRENLAKIDGALQQWALEHNSGPNAIPPLNEVVGASAYLRLLPVCPCGGVYRIISVSSAPTCSKHGRL